MYMKSENKVTIEKRPIFKNNEESFYQLGILMRYRNDEDKYTFFPVNIY